MFKKYLYTIAISMSIVTIIGLSGCGNTSSVETTTVDAAQESMEAYMETMETGGAYDKVPDPTALDLINVSVYNTSDDGKINKDIDGIEELDPQMMLDKLAEYGVVAEGTEVVSFEVKDQEEETAEAEESTELEEKEVSGPGANLSDESSNSTSEYAGEDIVMELSELEDDTDKTLTEIANTYIENFDLHSLSIVVDGQELMTDQIFNNDFAKIQ